MVPWFMPAILRNRTDFSGTAWGTKDAVFEAGVHGFAPGEKIHVYWLLLRHVVLDDDSIDRRDAMPIVPRADVARRVHRSLTFLTEPWPITASLRLHGSMRTKDFFVWFWEKRLERSPVCSGLGKTLA